MLLQLSVLVLMAVCAMLTSAKPTEDLDTAASHHGMYILHCQSTPNHPISYQT
jgi:ferredoxin